MEQPKPHIRLSLVEWHNINKTLWEMHALCSGFVSGVNEYIKPELSEYMVKRLDEMDKYITDVVEAPELFMDYIPEKKGKPRANKPK